MKPEQLESLRAPVEGSIRALTRGRRSASDDELGAGRDWDLGPEPSKEIELIEGSLVYADSVDASDDE